MTQAKIHPLPDSKWQPERHPRSDACFNSSPLGPSPCSQETTASCWPGLTGEEVGRRVQGRRWEKMLAQKENLDREAESQRLWNCAEKRAGAQLALLGKKPTDPQTGQAWRKSPLEPKH